MTGPRVALVAHRSADPEPSGIGRYYRDLVTALDSLPDRRELTLATPHERSVPAWLPADVGRRTVPGPRKALQLSWCLSRRPRIDRWLGPTDVVHALHTWAPVPTRHPLVVTVHDLMAVLHPEWYRADHGLAMRRGLAHAARSAAAIVAVSQWVADLVVEHLAVERPRLRVVHSGVSDRFRVDPASVDGAGLARRFGVEPGSYFLAVGQLAERKNLLTVVRAFARVPPAGRHRPWLVLAGKGPQEAALRDEARRLGVQERVRLAGYVPDQLLVPLLSGAIALVHPSSDEGFGFTPLEAMAAGTAVIASDAASLPEVVGPAGLLVAPTDVDGWAAAMQRVLDDDERARLVAAGDRRQAPFTWPAAAAATAAVYAEVAS
ncbi:MAG: glycosyltransferase family 4 protein [Acidimicrobiia bacterium]